MYMTKRNVLIIAIAVALVLLICLIGFAVSLNNAEKQELDTPVETHYAEPKETYEAPPINPGTNVSEDGEVIGDTTRLTRFVNETTIAYSKPSIESSHAASLPKGASVVVTKHSTKGWCEIEYDGVKMYIDAAYLSETVLEDEGEYPIGDDEAGIDAEDVEPTEPQYSEDGVYLIVNEEVRAEGNVWLRRAPKMSSQEVVILSHGKTIKRVGIGSNGWSQVLYNDEILYVTTYWVAPTKSPKYEEVQEFVKLTESANLRESGSINSRKIAALPNGVEMVRIGISQHGWSKVIYKGQIRYIYTLYVRPIDREVTEADLQLKEST